MRAFIYIGGEICPQHLTEHPVEGDLCIAADSGFHTAEACGDKVSVLVGDLDSIGVYEADKSIELLQVPAEKDATDTQLAVEVAISRGADDIILVGGFGGRADHELSNLSILEDLGRRGIHALMVNGYNRARFLDSTSILIPRSDYRYLSLLAIDPIIKGVEIQGCKYPLQKSRLLRSHQYAISNEITGNCALISVRKGALFIIESR